MKTLRSMSISRRLWLILLVAVAMLVVLGLLMLRQIHGDLYQAKAEKTRHVVQTAAGVLAYYQGLEAAGTLSRDAAQQQDVGRQQVEAAGHRSRNHQDQDGYGGDADGLSGRSASEGV